MNRFVGTDGLSEGTNCKFDNCLLKKDTLFWPNLVLKLQNEIQIQRYIRRDRDIEIFKDGDSEFNNYLPLIPLSILFVNLFSLLIKDKNKRFLSFHFDVYSYNCLVLLLSYQDKKYCVKHIFVYPLTSNKEIIKHF